MQLEDVKKLANLARIDMSESEMEEIAKDFDSILAYVDQIRKVSASSAKQGLAESEDYFLQNVMREDVVTNKTGEYTEKILKNAPDTESGFLKVKQIL
jgi:aspartyl-tRNA(Asn)/glutamyl-tRNA(Gln) amidotransferase subunit C